MKYNLLSLMAIIALLQGTQVSAMQREELLRLETEEAVERGEEFVKKGGKLINWITNRSNQDIMLIVRRVVSGKQEINVSTKLTGWQPNEKREREIEPFLANMIALYPFARSGPFYYNDVEFLIQVGDAKPLSVQRILSQFKVGNNGIVVDDKRNVRAMPKK